MAHKPEIGGERREITGSEMRRKKNRRKENKGESSNTVNITGLLAVIKPKSIQKRPEMDKKT